MARTVSRGNQPMGSTAVSDKGRSAPWKEHSVSGDVAFLEGDDSGCRDRAPGDVVE